MMLLIFLVMSIATLGVSTLVKKQNDEYGKNLLIKGVYLTRLTMKDLQKKGLQRVMDFVGDPSHIINMKYIRTIKGRKHIAAYKFILERPKEEMAMALAGLALEEDYDALQVYDAAGDLIIYVDRLAARLEAGFSTFNDEGQAIIKYRHIDKEQGRDQPWIEKPIPAAVLGSRSVLPLPDGPATWYEDLKGGCTLAGAVPFVSKTAAEKQDVDLRTVKAGESVGVIFFHKLLDLDFAKKLQAITEMEVNIFAGHKMCCGTLDKFDQLPPDFEPYHPALRNEDDYKPQVRVYSQGPQSYYQSILPLYKQDVWTGAVALNLSRADSLRKTRENIFLLLAIMGLCMGGAIPVAIFLAGKIAQRIDSILTVVKEITGGQLGARAEITSDDELGGLAGAVNQMAADLQHNLKDIRQSEEKYRNIFDFAPDGILITTFEGDILSFNNALMRIFKYYDRETFSGLTAWNFYQHPERDRAGMIAKLKEQGWLESYELEFKDRLGQPFTASLSLRLIQYADKTCIQSIMRDVTRIKKMEDELRNYSANLEKMVDEKTSALKLANHRLFLANLEAENMIDELEQAKSALESSNNELFVVNKNLEETREKLALSAHQAGMAELAVSILHNIGNAVNSVNVRLHRLQDSLGSREYESLQKIYNFLAEENLPPPEGHSPSERLGKLLRYFQTVIASLQETDNNRKEDLQFLRKGLDHILEIIALQERYAGIRGLETSVDINELLRDAVDLLLDSLNKRAIKIDFNLAPLPEIMLNKNKMMQVFINIIKNAYEAIDLAPPENAKEIQISTCLEKVEDLEYIKIVLDDTGLGFSPEIGEEVFRFNFSTKGRNTGFGLHDAANYVKAQEGFIDLLSPGPGQGAQLVIKLPVGKGVRP
jgi:PAS domain S-box-containing protein